MAEPKPPPADPKKDGGLKTPPRATPAPAPETGMLDEGERPSPPREERPGGMIGEG